MAKKNIDTTTVGGRIQELRLQAGLSQDELAVKLHLENRASVSSYETNRRALSGSLAVSIAKALNCSTDYILTGVNYSDSFIDEIVGLARTIESEEIKKMIVLQVKAATEMEKSVKLIE